MTEYLTQTDVSKLLKDKSEGARANAARKLGAQLQDGVMTASERRIAEEKRQAEDERQLAEEKHVGEFRNNN